MARADDLVMGATLQLTGPSVRWRALLEGAWYGFGLTYFDRDQRWRLELLDVAGAVQVQGLRVVEGRDMLRPFHYLTVPPGQLYVEDVDGRGRSPDRNAWSTWARMYYRPSPIVLLAAGTADEVS